MNVDVKETRQKKRRLSLSDEKPFGVMRGSAPGRWLSVHARRAAADRARARLARREPGA